MRPSAVKFKPSSVSGCVGEPLIGHRVFYAADGESGGPWSLFLNPFPMQRVSGSAVQFFCVAPGFLI